MWGFIIALLLDALMNIQGVFNTEVTRQTSIRVSAEFVRLTVFFTRVIVWLVTGWNEVGGLLQVQLWYILTGDAIGTLIAYTMTESMGTLGFTKSVLIIVVVQATVAHGIEVFGPFGADKVGFGWKKALGAPMATVGAVALR